MMSVLSDGTIRQKIEVGEIVLRPFDDTMIQPASVDVRLGHDFLLMHPNNQLAINPFEQQDLMIPVSVEDRDYFVLHPGEFALGTTFEYLEVPPTLVCRIEGKSSLGRLGVVIHSTAGFVDPGFKGHVTLELSNVTPLPIMLYPGMKVGQLSFMYMDKPSERPYGSGAQGSKYQDQQGPVASKYYLNPFPFSPPA
jgi:dCTP deaminase